MLQKNNFVSGNLRSYLAKTNERQSLGKNEKRAKFRNEIFTFWKILEGKKPLGGGRRGGGSKKEVASRIRKIEDILFFYTAQIQRDDRSYISRDMRPSSQ